MTVSLGQREIGVGRICIHLLSYVYFISLFIPTLFSRLLGKIYLPQSEGPRHG